MRKFWLVAIVATVLILTLGMGTYFYNQNKNEDTKTTPQEPTQDQQQTTDQAQTQSQKDTPVQPQTYPVNVYFSKHPESDDDPSKTFAVARVSPDLSVAKFAVTELLKGPTTQEQTQNYFSYVRLRNDTSNCSGADFKITVTDQVATLQFCKTFDHIGEISDGQAESSIKATLLQFPTVKKVIILNKSGDCEFNLSGLNLCKE